MVNPEWSCRVLSLPIVTASPQIHTDMKPVDYIGLDLIVIAASCITVNWLYRIYL